MHSIHIKILLLFLLTLSKAPQAKEMLSVNELIISIQQGGHLLYLRHTDTDKSQKDIDLSSCEKQRNLTPRGLQQAKLIGQKFKELKIPVSKVLSSPYCRTQETAKNAFLRYEVDQNLKFSLNQKPEELEKLGRYLLKRMQEADTTHGNVVFVGHTSNLKDALDVWPRPEGVMVIFKKTGDKLNLKGFIKAEDWSSQ